MLRTEALESATLAALNKLMAIPEIEDRILVGGTGLALHFGHRMSVDIDLFSNKQVDTDIIFDVLSEHGKTVLLNKTALGLHLIFEGVKTDIIRHPYEWIRPLYHEQNIRLASIEDIAAMKIAAITRRGSKKDFVDLYFLLKKHSIEEILAFFQEKFVNWDAYAAIRSLTYFEDAEQDDDPIFLIPKTNWNAVKKAILKEVSKFKF
jgi:hypothetical protein